MRLAAQRSPGRESVLLRERPRDAGWAGPMVSGPADGSPFLLAPARRRPERRAIRWRRWSRRRSCRWPAAREAVTNLHFQGIRVEHVDWPLPPTGYYGVFGCLVVTEGDKPIHKWMDAAVVFGTPDRCSFTKGGIAHAGGMGLCLLPGTAFDVVEGNEFCDLGGGGIGGGGIRNRSTLKWNPPPQEGDFRATVSRTITSTTAAWTTSARWHLPGPDAGRRRRPQPDPRHRLQGIVICGNEDPKLPFARNNTVEYNHIHHVMQVTVDGSGIYLSFPQAGRGCLVRGNLIHDTGHGGGIYFDPVGRQHGCAGYRCEKNIVYGSGQPLIGGPDPQDVWADNVLMKQDTPPQAVLDALRAQVGPTSSKRACRRLRDHFLLRNCRVGRVKRVPPSRYVYSWWDRFTRPTLLLLSSAYRLASARGITFCRASHSSDFVCQASHMGPL